MSLSVCSSVRPSVCLQWNAAIENRTSRHTKTQRNEIRDAHRQTYRQTDSVIRKCMIRGRPGPTRRSRGYIKAARTRSIQRPRMVFETRGQIKSFSFLSHFPPGRKAPLHAMKRRPLKMEEVRGDKAPVGVSGKDPAAKLL